MPSGRVALVPGLPGGQLGAQGDARPPSPRKELPRRGGTVQHRRRKPCPGPGLSALHTQGPSRRPSVLVERNELKEGRTEAGDPLVPRSLSAGDSRPRAPQASCLPEGPLGQPPPCWGPLASRLCGSPSQERHHLASAHTCHLAAAQPAVSSASSEPAALPEGMSLGSPLLPAASPGVLGANGPWAVWASSPGKTP